MVSFKHLLVDGWNAIHSHSQLRGVLESGGWQAARAELCCKLAPIHDFFGARLTIVYDGRGDDISIERPSECPTFSEVFTPSDMTADELIESLCAVSKNPGEIAVSTRDGMLSLTARSFGAFAFSPDELFALSASASVGLEAAAGISRRKNAEEWKKSNPFRGLDALALEIGSALPRARLISKRLKKKLKRMERRAESGGSAEGGVSAGDGVSAGNCGE